jgi:hypothetical protein
MLHTLRLEKAPQLLLPLSVLVVYVFSIYYYFIHLYAVVSSVEFFLIVYGCSLWNRLMLNLKSHVTFGLIFFQVVASMDLEATTYKALVSDQADRQEIIQYLFWTGTDPVKGTTVNGGMIR